ncbi:MAG: Gfo/Idh/MocA family protein [Nanoarchaeota archaeon]
MKKKLDVLIIGAGNRGTGFANSVLNFKIPLKIKAVAEPISEKRKKYSKDYKISKKYLFETGEQALNKNLPFDLVYIATPDRTHVKLALQALDLGYNLILEKPMATNAEDCMKIIKSQEKTGKTLSIMHVLRYAPFFQKLKNIIDSRELGKLLSVDLTERIGYWHFAHSYVRGNWRQESESGPVILTKSCHDLDIISWLVNSKVKNLFSKGSLQFFKKENSPSGAKEKCLDCPVKNCIYDAKEFYLTPKKEEWPYNVISTDFSKKARINALRNTSYGNCVWKSDNDVCDTQDVSISFENGAQADFRLRFHGTETTRRINLVFEKGEINGDLQSGNILKTNYKGDREKDEVEKIEIKFKGGHGGGDSLLIKNITDALFEANPEKNLTSAEQSLQSHLLAFASEESRKTGKVIDFQKYLDSIR